MSASRPSRSASASATPGAPPDALDLQDVADILSKLTGRTIRRAVADDDEWAAALVARGVPEAQAAIMLGLFRASRRGEFAEAGPALGELLAGPATPLGVFLERVTAAG